MRLVVLLLSLVLIIRAQYFIQNFYATNDRDCEKDFDGYFTSENACYAVAGFSETHYSINSCNSTHAILKSRCNSDCSVCGTTVDAPLHKCVSGVINLKFRCSASPPPITEKGIYVRISPNDKCQPEPKGFFGTFQNDEHCRKLQVGESKKFPSFVKSIKSYHDKTRKLFIQQFFTEADCTGTIAGEMNEPTNICTRKQGAVTEYHIHFNN